MVSWVQVDGYGLHGSSPCILDIRMHNRVHSVKRQRAKGVQPFDVQHKTNKYKNVATVYFTVCLRVSSAAFFVDAGLLAVLSGLPRC